MTVEVLINKITFFEDVLSISDTSLKLIAKLSPPKSLSAEVKGIVSIAGTDLDVHLRRSELTQKYVITIKAEVLPIFGIAKGLGADLLPGDLNAILGTGFQFQNLDAVIEYPFGVTPQQILISGTPQLWGLTTIHITAIGVKYGGRVKIIQKYTFGEFNIATSSEATWNLLHKIFILDQNTDIAFIVAPVSVPHDLIKLSELKGLSISKGISFRLPIGFPPDCSKDAFCAVCQSILAPSPVTALELEGESKLGKKVLVGVLDSRRLHWYQCSQSIENYFYVNMGSSLSSHFSMHFASGRQTPRPLAESGFQMVSEPPFHFLGKKLPHASISIPVGSFQDMSTSSLPYIEASGYAEVLGMSAEIKILISSSKYEYSINGKFLNLFYVGLRIQASYGNLANANFVVEGLFKNDLFDKIAAGVRDGLKRSADEADRHIKAAQNKIREKKEAFYRADRALVHAQRKVDDAKRALTTQLPNWSMPDAEQEMSATSGVVDH
ncbi:hypothetical protein GBAR_LOCUS2093, partial [Geodia barretti]